MMAPVTQRSEDLLKVYLLFMAASVLYYAATELLERHSDDQIVVGDAVSIEIVDPDEVEEE